MRELKPIQGGDEPGVLILAPIDWDGGLDGDAAAERFRLPITDELRELIAPAEPAAELSDDSVGAPSDGGAAQGTAAESPAAEPVDEPVAGDSPDGESPAADAPAAAEVGAPAAEVGTPSAAEVGAPAAPAPEKPAESEKPAEPRLILRPREIQDRVRAGASVADLVELTGMPQRRIEPFAHPVLAERARIAELGKQSRPRRSEGPAQLPLRDVLATAFAARGQDISEAEWDAWRDLSGQWIIGVTWSTGHSTTTAEYAFHAEGSATSTVARNTLAAELVDPEFARPRRSLSPVGEDGEPEPRRIRPIDDADVPASGPAGPESPSDAEDDGLDEDFMRHPDEDPAPRRRRKTVMPSWEDVLLGVRPTDRK